MAGTAAEAMCNYHTSETTDIVHMKNTGVGDFVYLSRTTMVFTYGRAIDTYMHEGVFS